MKYSMALAALILAAPALAENLYNPTAPASLVSDQRARQVGDVLTVLLVETTTAESRAGTSEDASYELQAGIKDASGLNTGGLTLGTQSAGDGRTARSGKLRGQISVQILEVLESGNFLVSGEQLLTINGEQQRIRIEGVARAADITADNAIASTRLVNAVIEYDGEGWVGRSQKNGWLRRLLVFLGF